MDQTSDQCPDRLRLEKTVSSAVQAVSVVSVGDRYGWTTSPTSRRHACAA